MAWWEPLISFLDWLPWWFVIIFISMIPFIELRGAIPIGIFYYDNLNWWMVVPLAIIGNMIPVPVILRHLGDVETWLRKRKWWDRFFTKLYSRTRARADAKIKKYEEIGVMFFVAIPLPFTGAWTGSLIAYLFNFEFKKALVIVFLGVCIAAAIVTLLCLFAQELIWSG